MDEQVQDTFLQEVQDLLNSMEDAFLDLETTPDDADAINEIFRAAHTIKGTAGVFSYDHVVEFTHVLESVLDRIRNGGLSVDDRLIALFLQSHDHIEVLVDAAVTGQEPAAQDLASGAALMKELNTYLDGGTEEHQPGELVRQQDGKGSPPIEKPVLEKPQVEKIESDKTVESNDWHISIRFADEVFQHGMDPASLLRYLNKLGTLSHVEVIDSKLPDFEQLDPECCYLGLELELNSEASKDEIEQAFEFVRELATVFILPPRARIYEYVSLIESLDEEDLKIGEILVRCGALSEHELKEILKIQESIKNKVPLLGDMLVENNVVHKEVVEVAAKKQAAAREKLGKRSKALRVDAEKLDGLINLVGELVISGATTNLLAARSGDEKLLEAISQMSRLVEEIRDSALTLRMVQVGDTFKRFQRIVRDGSKELGKHIILEINGGDTELDKTVIERISDPLMHLVRNAMDHGIETDEQRRQAGKSDPGTVKLNAYHDSGSIVIEVEDNGRGLDRDRILAKALERGLVTEGQVLAEHEIYKLIFEPGFSTAAQVTNMSGRGVGMDVVKRNIESLRGTIDVNSQQGIGTRVAIRLPLTLAIIDGFMVGVGESCYVIPLDMVLECIEIDEVSITNDKNQGYIDLRGEVLPFIKLGEMFGEQTDENACQNIVVVEFAGYKAGIVVDELLGEFQTVIKPLGKVLQNLQGISGATILGSGDVAVILDIPGLVQRMVHQNGHSGQNPPKTDNLPVAV